MCIHWLVVPVCHTHILHFHLDTRFFGSLQHDAPLFQVFFRLSRQLDDLHDTSGADTCPHGGGQQIQNSREGAPQGSCHGHKEGHGTIGDLSLPQAEDCKPITGVANELPNQSRENGHFGLEGILYHGIFQRLVLYLCILLDEVVHQSKGFDHLHVLQGLLVEYRFVAL